MHDQGTRVAGARPPGTVARAAELCTNCGEVCGGPYCSACGQRQPTGRHTLRSLARGFADRVLNIEHGITHTAYQLTVRPATVIGGYLAGRTVQYANPAGYLLVSVAVFVLSSRLISGPTGAADSDRFFTLLVIPFVAAAARALFWRGRFNYAEHLIAVMYLTAHVVLGLGVLYIAVPFINGSFITTYALIALAFGVVYFAWAYSRLFPRQPWLAAAGALGALVIGAASWLVVLVWVLAWFRNAFGR